MLLVFAMEKLAWSAYLFCHVVEFIFPVDGVGSLSDIDVWGVSVVMSILAGRHRVC